MKMKYIFILIFAFYFSNLYSQWEQSGLLNGREVKYFTRNGNFLFAGTTQSGVFRSVGNGDLWVIFNTNISGLQITGLTTVNNSTYLSVFGGGIFKSDSGNVFININGNLNYYGVDVLLVTNDYTFVFTDNRKIYRTTDEGVSWQQITQLNAASKFTSAVYSGNDIYLGTAGTGIYKSEDGGNNWAQINSGLGNLNVRILKVFQNRIFAGTQSGIFYSENSGNIWNSIPVNFSSNYITSLEISGNNIFAGTYGAGIYKSSNSGLTWTSINENLYILYINTIYKDTEYLFAGAGLGGALRRPLSQVISVKMVSSSVPDKFELSQNYPNPFNGSTSFIIQCPVAGYVKLVVYDVTGKPVKYLLDNYMQPGKYRIELQSSELSSGVYLCRMITDENSGFDSSMNKILILIK